MRFKVIFLVVIVMFFIGSAVMAQSWSEEQLEVWNNVNTVFKAAAGDDLDLVKGYFSENYRGWHVDSGDPHPKTMAQIAPWMEHSFGKNKMQLYTLHPLAIDIHNDTAVVFYVCDLLYADEEGKETRKAVKMMDVYQEQGGKWLLIADFTE